MNTVRIAVDVSPDFKKTVKETILKKNITSFQEGYLEIFKLGFKQFEKSKPKED